ncbi:head maturation protease, ClpP-related [Lysinibacillus sp. SG55]|uniref:head maturation protease, ClpP-related n=2 Tax=Lysinibacillus TaxID=400634 RepID=UPI0008820C58|nr:ATP-dependent protease ClpP, protease subunit [Lysinibacillus sp. SG9]SDB47108.1 ATP-dependent protease ClpP, protease subunit [Lysinibacillus sp. TC-37]SFT12324.1 ATP-dependent protease ClpP, protease subunit [Lysinibacillus sp. SG55]
MNKKQLQSFFQMKASVDGKSADVFIYGEITKWAWEEYGEVSSVTFKNELDKLGDVETIHLYINSDGGSVFEGVTIYNMLKRHEARIIVHIDALAASIASVIAMAGDEIRMPSNSMLMVHNAWSYVVGNAEKLRKAADDLDRINQSAMIAYKDKAGDKLDDTTLKELLDNETWLSAEKAFEHGLCDIVEEANEMVASVSEKAKRRYINVPQQLLQQSDCKSVMSAEEKALREKILADSKANLTYLNTIL